ncbi:MAG: pectinacetylesterase family protein [Desulfobacteraceae bacterium]|nr:pectinacetylesterase family protein [Desulfobacteraceae bacterium]
MKLSRLIGFFIFVVFVFGAAAAGHAKGPVAKPFLPDIPGEWTAVYPEELYPDFEYEGLSPACSDAPGTESDEFFFYVRGGSVNNLVVYFQGGGACWDPFTCFTNPVFTPDCTEDDNPVNYRGMFDLADPDNPFNEWSYVFIPYCTADVHWGANNMEYTGVRIVDEVPQLITHTIQHRGFVNFQVVLKWVTDHFEKPHKIFVTGSSAGAYGALGGFPWIKEAYPKSQVYLLGDAGMGVNPPEFDEVTEERWNVQLPPWIFGEGEVPATPEVWKEVAAYYPHSKMGEFTNAWDGTQIAFYQYMFQTLGIPMPPDIGVDWHMKMWEGLETKTKAPNYRYYVAGGGAHTILARENLYFEDSAEGVYFLDWLEAMVKSQGGTRGHGAHPWNDLECDICR